MSNIILDIVSAIGALQTTLCKRVNIKSQKGATIIDYAFLSILIAAVLIGSVQSVGDKILELYNAIQTAYPNVFP
jgi:Flp pilus assembly pilin Flp